MSSVIRKIKKCMSSVRKGEKYVCPRKKRGVKMYVLRFLYVLCLSSVCPMSVLNAIFSKSSSPFGKVKTLEIVVISRVLAGCGRRT
jgi:hypothetical protein